MFVAYENAELPTSDLPTGRNCLVTFSFFTNFVPKIMIEIKLRGSDCNFLSSGSMYEFLVCRATPEAVVALDFAHSELPSKL